MVAQSFGLGFAAAGILKLMFGLFLFFQTPQSRVGNDWFANGNRLLKRIGDIFESDGFAIDYQAGAHDPDWIFIATKGSHKFAVVLVNGPSTREQWSVGFEDGCQHALEPGVLRTYASNLLDVAIRSWDEVTRPEWHDDPTRRTIGK